METWLFDIPVTVWIGGALALYMAWAIGANDVANVIGPLAAVVHVAQDMDVTGKSPVEPWMLGVGLARGIGVLDMRVVGRILVSWVMTLPIAAILSVFFFYFFKGLLTP